MTAFRAAFLLPFAAAFLGAFDVPRVAGGGGPGPVDEAVDLLFDVAFTAGVGGPETGFANQDGVAIFGTLDSILPADFLGEGAATWVSSGLEPSAYIYVRDDAESMGDVGLDADPTFARLYQRDVLIASAMANVVDDGDPIKTRAEFGEAIEFAEHDQYRIRIFDQEPPADMQMLFGVEGVAGQDGVTSAVAWNAEGNVLGSLSKLTPSYFTPAPESETTCSVESDDFATSFYLLAAYSSDRSNVVSKGTGFDYAGQPVLIRVYGDGQLIGEQESNFYVTGDYAYAISANFGGPSFSEGQTIAVRGWVPTASVEHRNPVALTPPSITGTVQEGLEVNIADGVWANLFDGIESETVNWTISTAEVGGDYVGGASLPIGTPYTLPPGCAGNWLRAAIDMQVNVPGGTRGGGAPAGPPVQIAAP